MRALFGYNPLMTGFPGTPADGAFATDPIMPQSLAVSFHSYSFHRHSYRTSFCMLELEPIRITI